jgi:glycosyltransferase involved in cell wall biosynthesis
MSPNLFLFAAPRAGSTQLARWLDSHPDIALAPVKEPNHFSEDDFPEDHVRRTHLNDVDPATYARDRRKRPAQFAVFRDPTDYRALFADLGTRWRCDASTSYLASPAAPSRAAAACPGAMAITLTRDPLERALSHYRLARRTGRSVRSLAAELEEEIAGTLPPGARFLLRPSLQADGVARVHAVFGSCRHLALRFEEMRTDPPATLARVARFLDIDPAGFDLSVEARNPGVAPRFPSLNRALFVTGAKTWLRRALPTRLKTRLKPLYFQPGAEIPVTPAERAMLSAALTAAERATVLDSAERGMKILIAHADLAAGGGAEAYANAIAGWLEVRGHAVDRLDIHGLRGAQCAAPTLLRLGRLPGLRHLILFRYALVCRVLPGLAQPYDHVFLTFGEGPPLDRPSVTLHHAPALFSTDPAALAALGAEGRGRLHLGLRQIYTRACRAVAGTARPAPTRRLANSCWTARTIAARGAEPPPAIIRPPVAPRPNAGTQKAPACIVALGRIVRNKRLEEAIAILAGLQDLGLPAELHIVGRAGCRYADRLIRRHSGRPGLHVHADADDASLSALLARARFGLHCYRHEHFGIAVAEMITAGTVPLVYDGGGVRELVTRPDLRFRSPAEAVRKLAALIARPVAETDAIAAELARGPALAAALDFEAELARVLPKMLEAA